MQIDDTHLEGAMGSEFIKRGICPELSLGYHVTMSRSPAGFLKASNKRVVELSLVRQGTCFLALSLSLSLAHFGPVLFNV